VVGVGVDAWISLVGDVGVVRACVCGGVVGRRRRRWGVVAYAVGWLGANCYETNALAIYLIGEYVM